MKKFSLLAIVTLSLCFSLKVNAQNTPKISPDSVVLTTNSADVVNLIPIGQVDITTNPVYLGGKKKLTAQCVLLVKRQAAENGANLVFVKSNDYINVTKYNTFTGNVVCNAVRIQGTLYSGKPGAKQNGAPAATPANAGNTAVNSSSDLSGKWEGYQTNGQLIMSYEIDLTRIGENSYSGFDYCRWVKSADGSPLKYTGTELPHAKKVFLAVFKDGVLNVNEVNNIENSNWDLMNEQFKLTADNGAQILIAADGNTGTRRFSMKRTGDYPADYAKYVISRGALKIDTVNYHNPALANSIRYNEKGYLEFPINNQTANSFHGLKVNLSVDNTSIAGVNNSDAASVSFDIAGNSQKPLAIHLSTNLMLPADPMKVRLVISSNGTPLAIKYFSIPTIAFIKTPNVTSPAYTSARMRAISGFYGFLNNPYKTVPASLEPLVASGDKIAGMWKAVFLSMGSGGYKLDEALGATIGSNCLKAVEDKARNGDAEALYLLFYACQMGLEGETGKTFAISFLEKAATAGFKPAVYDYGKQFVWQKDYSSAYSNLSKSYSMGVPKAAEELGEMYEKGAGVSSDVDSAVIWFKRGIAFGDPEAMLSYAELLAKGVDNNPPNITKALALSTQAAAKNCTDAMVFNGSVYFDGNMGVAKNLPLAIKWFKDGAELGDRQAMFALGECYISGKHGAVNDQNSGLYWIKTAAQLGSPTAMVALAHYYNDGTFGEKDIISARFWYNQAVINGYAQANNEGMRANAENFMNFWKYADFSPSYIYVNEYGDKVADGDDGLMNGLVSGMFGAMANYYGNQQQLIDGLKFIYKKKGNKVYGGVVSSNFVSNLYLKQGQTVHIHAYGVISTGMMSGLANADGLGNAWAEYRIVPTIPCSAVMAGIKGSSWQFIGQDREYTAPKDGPLVIALNGIDYRNYKGYFDMVIEVPSN